MGFKFARYALVASIVIWAGSLLAIKLTGGRLLELATLVSIAAVVSLIVSAATCLVLGAPVKRKVR
jgi:hypothetical protein